MGRLDNSRKHPSDLPQHNARSATAANIVTYRLDSKMVYVTPADTYEQAIDYAKTVFPDELDHVDRHRIVFSVSVFTPQGAQTVQIGPMAWTAVISTLARYEIIDILVQPEVIIEDTDATPPNYADITSKEEFHLMARSKSTPPAHSDSRLRTPSPETSSRREKAKSWIEKHLQ